MGAAQSQAGGSFLCCGAPELTEQNEAEWTFSFMRPAAPTPTPITSEIHLSHKASTEDQLFFLALNDQIQ